MHSLPNEILLLIYKFTDIHSRLNMNKVMRWSYRAANPFMGQQIVPLYPKVVPKKLNMFNYVMRGH